tara:strand:- start:5017 stop:5562 length:546 start_codon:yes stop_codon:yes gene_type:complete
MYDTFFYIAIAGTIVMSIMILASVMGIGDDGMETEMETDTDTDVDGDFSGNLLPSFSIKNLFSFLAMFGWVGMACLSYSLTPFLSITIATFSGVIFVILLNLLFVAIYKLAHTSPMSLNEAVDKKVTVYSRITKDVPGQVTVTLNGSLQTIMASSNKKTFQTGETVKVVSVNDTGLLVDSI